MGDNVIRLSEFEMRERREDVLSRRTRVRRTAEIPRDLKHDLQAGVRFPKAWASPLADVTVRYRLDRWDDLDWRGTVHQRQLTAWLMHRRKRVGALRFAQYKFDSSSNDDVFFAMDAVSTEAARLGDVLTICWPDFTLEVGGYGSVVELETIWLAPGILPPWSWLPVAESMIEWFWRQRAALFVTHLYPLEYSQLVGQFTASRIGFERRRRAMSRACERRLGLTPFPGELKGLGWMWRPRPGLEEEIPPPKLFAQPQTTLLF